MLTRLFLVTADSKCQHKEDFVYKRICKLIFHKCYILKYIVIVVFFPSPLSFTNLILGFCLLTNHILMSDCSGKYPRFGYFPDGTPFYNSQTVTSYFKNLKNTPQKLCICLHTPKLISHQLFTVFHMLTFIHKKTVYFQKNII